MPHRMILSAASRASRMRAVLTIPVPLMLRGSVRSRDRQGVRMGLRPSQRDGNRFSGGRWDAPTAEDVPVRAASWWGRMPSCAAVDNRSAVRLAIGPQLTKLPHKAERAIFNGAVAADKRR